MDKRITGWIAWAVVLSGLLIAVSIFSLCLGSSGIPWQKVFSLILHPAPGAEASILFDIRLPRILLGFAIGGALALCGVILQGMFRNPLVEPYTLGISGGAAVGVCLNLIFGLNRLNLLTLPLFGFLGSALVIVLVYGLSLKKGILRIQGLLLTGVMITFISSSLIMLFMAISGVENLHGIIFWIMGSLEEPSWLLIKLAVTVSLAGLLISYLFSVQLNALSLGQDQAQGLGIDVERTKRFLFVLASLLTGLSVAICGIIGFVGLVVPHFMRMFVGRDHRILLVGSFLGGASFLIFCDTLARIVISPLELPVGVITGILGGSLFIYALTKKRIILGEK